MRSLLYHHMDAAKAIAVLTGDAMPGRFRHHDPVSCRHLGGNSFSRNVGMGVRGTDCVRLVADRDSLRARHRIVPFDADAAYERYRRFLDDAGQVDWEAHGDYHDAYDLDPNERDRLRNAAGLQWAEEFVVGDIRDLHVHLLSVEVNHVPGPRWTTLRSAAVAFGRRHGIPVEIGPEPVRPSVGSVSVMDHRTVRAVPVLDPFPRPAGVALDIPYEPGFTRTGP